MENGITKPESLRRFEYWRAIVASDENAWAAERNKMDWREKLYSGTHEMKATCKAEEPLEQAKQLKCYHVRNVVAENIESMVDSRVPKPKVMALDKKDERLAAILEQLLVFYGLRNHLRRINDMAERMGPIQGGVLYLVEWDDSVITPDGPGDVVITLIHPKQLIPQAGVFSDIEDMDHVALKQTMTVDQVQRRFGIDVSSEFESDPGAKTVEEDAASENGIVTVETLFYRNGKGGVGQISWAGDVLLCDREDYQARRAMRCKSCGAVKSWTQKLSREREEELELAGRKSDEVERCLWCEGTEFEEAELDGEEIMPPGRTLMSNDGEEIELKPAKAWLDKDGRLRLEPQTIVPFYRPNQFPLKLQKNISAFGKLLGESDVDKMEDQQNTIKRLDKKIMDRLIKAGTKITLPTDIRLAPDTEDQRAIYLDDPSQVNMIKPLEFTGDISKPLEMSARAYEEARQASGITDSMQGRRDPTATSAKAKEFSAAKSEGRMESRRVMKQEAWSRIYEMIAKLYLSCADEGRRVRVESATGNVEYMQFDRWDFLKRDKDGSLYFEDGFVFSVDDATSIGESREAMWKEINASFTAGTLGNPQDPSTLILYWGLMEEQAYPGAGSIKKKLEERLQQAQEAQANAAKTQMNNPIPTMQTEKTMPAEMPMQL